MRTIVLLLCLVTTGSTFAQDNPVLVKISPLCLIDGFSFPTVQGGIEFSISRKISWYNEYGFRYRTTSYEKTDTSFVAVKGFKAKTEVRYYFGKATGSHPGNASGKHLRPRLDGYYMAVNLFYSRDVHNATARYYSPNDSTTRKEDVFGIQKNVWGINLLLGQQTPIDERLMIEFYYGFGVRFRDMSAVNKEFDYERDDLIEAVDVTINGFKYKAESKGGESVIPHLTAGVRIAFIL